MAFKSFIVQATGWLNSPRIKRSIAFGIFRIDKEKSFMSSTLGGKWYLLWTVRLGSRYHHQHPAHPGRKGKKEGLPAPMVSLALFRLVVLS